MDDLVGLAGGLQGGRNDILCCYTGCAGKCVEGYTFTEEKVPDWSADSGAVGYWFYGGAFLDVPFHADGN